MSGENVGAIYYTVEADTQKLLNSVTPADQSLDRLQKTFDRTDKAANQANFQMNKTAVAVKSIGRESQTAASSLGGLTKLLGGYLTMQGANALIQMAEGYREMGERIRFATSSQEEYEMVQQRLLSTANGTYRALAEAQEVYILTADSLRSMGYSTEDALDITDSLSYSFVKNAASTQRAQSAINAYTKSIQTGKVQADSWQSLLAAVPSIISDIAAASNISAEQVRKLGAEGKLTAQQLNEGLRQSLNSNKAAADGMATTVRDAFNNMRNSLSVYLGESQSATSATGLLSSAILVLGNNIETVVQVLMAAGAGALARYIAQIGASVIAKRRAVSAAKDQVAEELRLAQAHVTVTGATLAHTRAKVGLVGVTGSASRAADAHAAALARLTVATRAASTAGATLSGVLGGPVGIIALIATAGMAFLTMGGSAKTAAGGIDEMRGALERLDQQGLASASNAIAERIDQTARLAIDAQDKLARLQEQLASEPLGSGGRTGIISQMQQWGAVYGEAQKNLDTLKKRQQEIEDTVNRRSEFSRESKNETDQDVEKKLQALRNERELVEQVGAARAKLQIIQQLGDKATQAQKDEAARLAAEIYEIEEARKKSITTTKDSIKSTEENIKAINKLAESLYFAGLQGEALAVAQARSSLNEYATPEQIVSVDELAKAMYRAAEAKTNLETLKRLDPLVGERERYESELQALKNSNEAKQIENERYLDLKDQAERRHLENMLVLQEQNFRAQSEWNDTMMSSLDALSSAGTSAISGLVTGMNSGENAAKSLANSILNGVVGSFVEMGIAQVKAWVMGQAAQVAAGSAWASSVAGQVAATTALAAQAAYASTAAIPVYGPAAAPLAATAAMAEAASLGAPAVAASSASFAGGRQYGGSVAPEKMYRVNENGAPEVLNTASGQQYLLPNSRGDVVSNKDASSRQGGINVSVVINNAPPGTTANVQQDADDDKKFIVDVMVGELMTQGRFTQTGRQYMGWKRQGT